MSRFGKTGKLIKVKMTMDKSKVVGIEQSVWDLFYGSLGFEEQMVVDRECRRENGGKNYYNAYSRDGNREIEEVVASLVRVLEREKRNKENREGE